MRTMKSGELTLPCLACREYAVVGYERADHIEDRVWTCPSCGEPNQLQLKGRITDAIRHPAVR